MKDAPLRIAMPAYAFFFSLGLGASALAKDGAAILTGLEAAAKILPAEAGRKACWKRSYDAAHLRAHPEQKVTQMLFLLRVAGYDAKGGYVFRDPDHIAYNFAIAVKRRDDRRRLDANGDCGGEAQARCAVDCDGGGVVIAKPESGEGLMIRIDKDGVGFGNDCDTKRGTFVYPGADDKVFRLEPAPQKACDALEKSTLGAWK